jgi:hypothetical protein
LSLIRRRGAAGVSWFKTAGPRLPECETEKGGAVKRARAQPAETGTFVSVPCLAQGVSVPAVRPVRGPSEPLPVRENRGGRKGGEDT